MLLHVSIFRSSSGSRYCSLLKLRVKIVNMSLYLSVMWKHITWITSCDVTNLCAMKRQEYVSTWDGGHICLLQLTKWLSILFDMVHWNETRRKNLVRLLLSEVWHRVVWDRNLLTFRRNMLPPSSGKESTRHTTIPKHRKQTVYFGA